MKKIILAVAVLAAAVSCDFLNVVPEGSPSEKDLYKTQTQAQTVLYRIYDHMPDLLRTQQMPDLCGGDDILSSYYGAAHYFAWKSLIFSADCESPTNSYFDLWKTTGAMPSGVDTYDMYEGIRYAYNFLNHIGSVPDITDTNLKIWTGEAHFLIAYFHHQLLTYYGPCIIVRGEYPLNAPASEINVARSPYDECVDFICEEYDEAAKGLPDYWGDIPYGRAIKAAALGMKARLLLYAASPLVNGNTEFYSDFTNKDGTHLINQVYDKEKWKRAMDASKVAIDYVEAHPQLGLTQLHKDSEGQNGKDGKGRENYTNIFTGDGTVSQWLNKEEYLFTWNRANSVTYVQRNYGCHETNDYTRTTAAYRGYNCPTVEAAEMYYTEHGVPWEDDITTGDGKIDPYGYDSAAETANLHLHREPRFYATIAYDRGDYRFNGGKLKIKARKGEPQGFTGNWEHEYQSFDGYFVQKWINEQSRQKLDGNNAWAVDTYMQYVYPYLRVAELYLNYAEADFEYNGTLSEYGYECLDKVRTRSGLPKFKDSWTQWSSSHAVPTGDKLRDIIRRERSIEFLLEGRRFHDLRRWKLAHTVLSQTPKAWNIEGSTAEDFYKMGKMKENDVRIFNDKTYYWLAIPNSQMNVNGNLVQNPGY